MRPLVHPRNKLNSLSSYIAHHLDNPIVLSFFPEQHQGSIGNCIKSSQRTEVVMMLGVCYRQLPPAFCLSGRRLALAVDCCFPRTFPSKVSRLAAVIGNYFASCRVRVVWSACRRDGGYGGEPSVDSLSAPF